VANERAQRGHSFRTRNIGLILALRFRHDPTNGLIIATTHLFWHPKCVHPPFSSIYSFPD
jgi:RNA exonuclease NGL2